MAHSLAPSCTLHLFNQSFHRSTNQTTINHKQKYVIYLCTWLNAIIILQHFVVVVEVCQDLPDIKQKTHIIQKQYDPRKNIWTISCSKFKSLCVEMYFLSSLVGNFLSFDLLEVSSRCLFADQEGLVKLSYILNPGKPAIYLKSKRRLVDIFLPNGRPARRWSWNSLPLDRRWWWMDGFVEKKRGVSTTIGDQIMFRVCSYGQWSY